MAALLINHTLIRSLRRVLTARFVKFCAVGFLGFIMDVALTYLLIALGLGAVGARFWAIGGTILFCWQLNRHLTFGPSQISQMEEGVRYFGVAIATGAVNYLIYVAILSAVPALWPIAAIVLSTAVCTFLSYIGYSRFAFKGAEPGDPSCDPV